MDVRQIIERKLICGVGQIVRCSTKYGAVFDRVGMINFSSYID